jgi:2-polyprenyl-6-methoxyphenol hydroxylase-like FAD-dependent oxidoreductase
MASARGLWRDRALKEESSMGATHHVPVIIVGAGPVGLTLASDLAWRGVACLVIEARTTINPHPRAISIGVRSMEHFRRLGLDQKVIDAGVPRDQRLDVIYVTRILGREIHRFPIPSIDDLVECREELARDIPETRASPFYKTWTAQAPLERVLDAHITAQPCVEFRRGWRLEAFTEENGCVEARLVDAARGSTQIVTADFLVGCDGAASPVREGLGVALTGRGALGAALGLYFRAPGLRARLGAKAGVMYWPLAPGCGGTIYTIDGGDEWVFNRYFSPGEKPDIDDPLALIKAAIGAEMEVELISALDWIPRQLVAESYGTRRVFLAGDACHLFVPTGGFGMNTGVGDAVDLAWKIEATLAGWGGPSLLASYDRERRPIGLRNTLEAADNYARSGDIFSAVGQIESEDAVGERQRTAIAASLPPKIKHFAPIGVHLGYHYDQSPIIMPDGTPPPENDAASYTPTSRPGHRAPHVWLADGRSTLDLFGRGFALLCFGGAADDSAGLIEAARARGAPLSVHAIDETSVAAIYEKRFCLVRPDGHVAWRGDQPPTDPAAMMDMVCGA